MAELTILQFKKKTLANFDRVRRGVAMRIFSGTIRSTPVDTGRLRANWQTSLGQPVDTVTDNTDPSGAATIKAALGAVKQSPTFGEIWFTNNLPYAHRVEYEGWSHTKAPAGMLRINFRRVAANLAKEVASVK